MSDTMLLLQPPFEDSIIVLPFVWRGGFEDLTHVSGEMKPQMMLIIGLSIGSVTTFFVFPIKLPFNHCCRNAYARCAEVLAEHSLFLKDMDVLPIFHPYIKLKIHLEIPGHTHREFQNINKWRKHFTAWISVPGRQIHWVAFRGVAQHGVLWVLIVCSVSINCNTPSSLRQGEHNSLCLSPSRTQKVSWTLAQINVLSAPAGVVSGSPG